MPRRERVIRNALRRPRAGLTAFCLIVLTTALPVSAQELYPWTDEYDSRQALLKRIAVPEGYVRIQSVPESFATWLRNLPLKPDKPEVLLYNGQPKQRQDTHYAVLDIDVGDRDLQQCADAIIRLQAEYLRATGRENEITFNFTSGDTARWSDWRKGHRPVVRGNDVEWKLSAEPSDSYESLRQYLDTVFMYAGTWSLHRELEAVDSISDMRIGDVFIQPGFPGHACMVADMAEEIATGKKVYLLLESFTPAQEMVILRNPNNPDLTPWYELTNRGEIITPDWTFESTDLHRSKWVAEH